MPSAQVLNEARPLADLLWMRETSGGVFDTPERRAELEKTMRELTSRIRDESVRFHYNSTGRQSPSPTASERSAMVKRTAGHPAAARDRAGRGAVQPPAADRRDSSMPSRRSTSSIPTCGACMRR
jgi:DNA primase